MFSFVENARYPSLLFQGTGKLRKEEEWRYGIEEVDEIKETLGWLLKIVAVVPMENAISAASIAVPPNQSKYSSAPTSLANSPSLILSVHLC